MKPPAPTRGLAPEIKTLEDDSSAGGSVQAFNPADLIPRTDIRFCFFIHWYNILYMVLVLQFISVFSGQLTSALLTDMTDKNWKVRLEALQKLAAIVNEAKFVEANLGDLPTVFRSRMVDSNKNLVK